MQPELYRESLSEKNGQLMEGGMHKGKQKQLKKVAHISITTYVHVFFFCMVGEKMVDKHRTTLPIDLWVCVCGESIDISACFPSSISCALSWS